MSDEQKTENAEVEGQGFRGGAPADEVEGQAKRFFKRGEDAEAPESTDLEDSDAASSEAADDAEVEGQAKKFFRGTEDV